MQVGRCPCCGNPVLAVKITNCTVCNEPTASTHIRSDFLASGHQMTGICRGDATDAEVNVVQFNRTHATQTEASYEDRVMVSRPVTAEQATS